MPIIAGRASAAYGAGFGAITTPPFEVNGSYDYLSTVIVPSGNLASITFNGIPSGYKHLQVRYNARTTNAYQFDFINMIFNSDTSASYRTHLLSGSGASATSENLGVSASFYGMGIAPGNTNTTNVFGSGIIDILDYSNTNKNTTVRTLSGFNNNDSNNGRQIGLGSGLYIKTNAVISISINGNGGNLIQNSSFTLYGVR
jgi:hypothetical protein